MASGGLICELCAYARKHGWWGFTHGESHCGDAPRAGVIGCHRTWRGTTQAHCVGCHRHFSSDGAARLHRVGDSCVDPATLRDKVGVPRLVLRDDAFAETWGYPSPDADAAVPRRPKSVAGGRE